MCIRDRLTAQPVLQPYLVDNEGKINFPVLGELKVGGLTKKEAEQLIVEDVYKRQRLARTTFRITGIREVKVTSPD